MRNILSTLFFVAILMACSSGPGIREKLPIPDDFNPSYKIASKDRIDYEWDGLDIMRISYRIVIPKLRYEDIRYNCRHLTVKTYESGIHNVSILAYSDESEMNGPYTVALYEFCPYGDWGRTNEMYATPLKDYGENFQLR
ncbi:hypothetical protein [Bacteroides heparinolyticus]|uniref:hypothetical protein n=1 Tax=Prevotella heparinolytica TaxID=28113 RepID=UPI00359F74B4